MIESAPKKTRQLQRRIVTFSVFGMLLIGAIVGVVSIVALYDELRVNQENTLIFATTTKSMAVEEFLARAKDTAKQIASRTKIRQSLVDYNAGRITLEEFLPFTRKGLGDAISGSDEIDGVARHDAQDRELITLGEFIPLEFRVFDSGRGNDVTVLNIRSSSGAQHVVLRSPVIDNGVYAGTDFIFYRLDDLHSIIGDYVGLGETGETMLVMRIADQFSSLFPERGGTFDDNIPLRRTHSFVSAVEKSLSGKTGIVAPTRFRGDDYVFSFGKLSQPTWAIITRMQQNEFYQPVKDQIVKLSAVIVALVAGGALVMLGIIRPMAGRIIVQSREMEMAVNQKSAALVASEAKIRAIVDSADSGIITANEIGIIDTFNPAAEALFGYSAQEAIGQSIMQLLPGIQTENGASAAGRRTEEHASARTRQTGRELSARHRDGHSIPVEVNVSDLQVGEEQKITVLVRDITRRKQAEDRLNQQYKELQDANLELKQAQQQLLQSEKMASIGQLAAGVAHEINNPIGYVNSNFGALNDYVNDLLKLIDAYKAYEVAHPEIEELKVVRELERSIDIAFVRKDVVGLLEESAEGIKRVRKIVRDLREFSHVSEENMKPVDLTVGIESTLNIARNETKYKAEVVKRFGQIPQVECVPSQINQVFMNLIVNAAQAIEERGTITITTRDEPGSVIVEVSDTGPGIAPEILGRIFEPFFTTKDVGKGTGLGLSLSYSIIENHHGSIEVESELGKGTTFRIRLPVVQPKNEGEATPTENAQRVLS